MKTRDIEAKSRSYVNAQPHAVAASGCITEPAADSADICSIIYSSHT